MSADMLTTITIEYPGTMKMEADVVHELMLDHVDLSEASDRFASDSEPKPNVSGFGAQVSYDDLESSSDLNADWDSLAKALHEKYPGAILDVFARWSGEEPNESRHQWRAGEYDLWHSFTQVEQLLVVPELVRQAKEVLDRTSFASVGAQAIEYHNALSALVKALS